jgi:hypothetical protein
MRQHFRDVFAPPWNESRELLGDCVGGGGGGAGVSTGSSEEQYGPR